MATQSHTIAAPSAPLTTNDNRPMASDWPPLLALLNGPLFGPRWAAAAWRAKASGQTALGFLDDLLAAN